MRVRSIVLTMICTIPLLLPCVASAADGPLFSPQGYRIARYRAPLPAEPPAGKRLDTVQLVELIQQVDPLLLDVQAVTVRPETEEFGIAWLPSRQRWHIPGSTWLPNVGYGQLDSRMRAYLKSNLERLTRGDRDRALVLYCVVDCWMSWNAVKRVAAMGYRNLYWYAEGSDGWQEAGLELVPGVPVPLLSK
ncbi:rhodanese-like domain-containing protein [Candidatus Thiodiazotropha sp. CDECU1]|uniref:rhodanese-like domain-containing protein n=1 Tax=Candidatus Thiodiazotropha sp. CDECU1 TaxID=3065865 RepID=UPI002930FD66|nr:rhodanese-like domain-containing protein [Candidatus Thiodiazotropha sp. CDECU1]